MGNMVEIFNKQERRVIFYEVSDTENIAIWGGESALEALKWFRNSPNGSKIYVQEWITTEEDAQIASQMIEITPIVLATIANCMDRWI